jgi:hypothetical protein
MSGTWMIRRMAGMVVLGMPSRMFRNMAGSMSSNMEGSMI